MHPNMVEDTRCGKKAPVDNFSSLSDPQRGKETPTQVQGGGAAELRRCGEKMAERFWWNFACSNFKSLLGCVQNFVGINYV